MWILSHHELEQPDLGCLRNLKKFHAKQSLAHATLFFMATSLATTEEMEEMRQLFSTLDTNHDGVLSEKEILEGFIKLDVVDPV